MAGGHTIGLGDLHRVLRQEKKSSTLSELEPEFYARCSEYIEGLELEIERKRRDEKETGETNPELRALEETLEKARSAMEKIFLMRQRKILTLAYHRASGLPVKKDGLTFEERELFDAIVEALMTSKDAVLGTGSAAKKRRFWMFRRKHYRRGIPAREEEKEKTEETEKEEREEQGLETKEPETDSAVLSTETKISEKKTKETKGSGGGMDDIAPGVQGLAEGEGTGKTTLPERLKTLVVLEDLDEFVGPHGVYSLKKDDVVSLPEDIADILINAGKARGVEHDLFTAYKERAG